MTSTGRAPAAWYPDPTGRHQYRYWDGNGWTVNVADDGVARIDDRLQQPVAQETNAVTTPSEHESSTAGWTADGGHGTHTSVTPGVEDSPTGSVRASRSSGVRAVVVGIAVLVAAAGVGATAVLALSREPEPATTYEASNHYPAAVESTFVSSCTANGGTENYCRCALTQIEQDYDLAAFSDAEHSIVTTGQIPDSMRSAIVVCLPQQIQK